jgi:4-diphosphocytidyl-2-C-methyl-D-erythritol kinase
MIVFPNAKINIGLNIIQKRTDGYHDIETCFYPLQLKDALEIIPANTYSFNTSGLHIPQDGQSNLVEKAYHKLKDSFDLPPVAIHLHKVIPMGAGLGGGSSDAAFTLKTLNKIFQLNIGQRELKTMAGELGSDCAFFIENQPAVATGRGDELTPIRLQIPKDFHLLLIFPGIHSNTQSAYAGVVPEKPLQELAVLLNSHPAQWKGRLNNAFEPGIFETYPLLKKIKEELYSHGAVYAAMSGSGSAVYGIFEDPPNLGEWYTYEMVHHQRMALP